MQLGLQQLTSTAIHGDQHYSNCEYRQRCPLHGCQVLAQQPHSKQGCWHDLETLGTDLEGDSIKVRCSNNDQYLQISVVMLILFCSSIKLLVTEMQPGLDM